MDESTNLPPEPNPISPQPTAVEQPPKQPTQQPPQLPTPPPTPSPEPKPKPFPEPQPLTPAPKTKPAAAPPLPAPEPAPKPIPPLTPQPTPSPTPNLSPTPSKKILLVDDDEIFSQLYASVLTSSGFNCSIAEHGLEALDAAKEEKPDLILLDIMMPDINGLEVLKRLKREAATAAITVWMMTNLSEQIDQETATSLGAGDYLVKSSNTPKQVCEKINAFFAGVAKTPPAQKG